MSSVFFHYLLRKISIKNKQELKSFIENIFLIEKKKLKRLDYIFCSDEHLLQINQNHLKHNYYTDVITFDLSETKAIKGEIYISINRVTDNAKILNEDLTKELLRVIFHGALHLCGYNDKTKEEKNIMRQKENKYLFLFFNQ